jgi:hypothetical protein
VSVDSGKVVSGSVEVFLLFLEVRAVSVFSGDELVVDSEESSIFFLEDLEGFLGA